MMDEYQRKEVLDLLAQGKISIDEAVEMLSQETNVDSKMADEPVHKVDLSDELQQVETSMAENKLDNPSKKNKPNWLRIKVSHLESGQNKVLVNIPFGLVEFGMGMAHVFAPKEHDQFENFKNVLHKAEPGLLVDVEDSESNEHVQIYFE